MKTKNIILTLCCISLGLLLNFGTAFAEEYPVHKDLTKETGGFYSFYKGNTKMYITEAVYQDACAHYGMSASPDQLNQGSYGSSTKVKPGTSTSHLAEGVIYQYNGYVEIDPKIFYDPNSGDSNLNYLQYAEKMYMTLDTYNQLKSLNGGNLDAKAILDRYVSRTISELDYNKLKDIISDKFLAELTEKNNKGYVYFSATPPNDEDLADAAFDGSIYFYCDIGNYTGQYGHAENFAALYMNIKEHSSEYGGYEFAKDGIDTSDNGDSLVFAIENSTANICSISAMVGIVKQTLLFTQGEISIIESMLQTIIPIAYCLMVLYFVLEIANIASRDITNISADVYIKAFAKLIIAVLIIGNSYKIIIYGANLANGLTDMILKTVSGNLDLPPLSTFVSNAARADTSSFLEMLKGCLAIFSALTNLLLIPFNFIVVLILSVQCYSRKIEFLLRSLFLPMAIADIAGKGLESNGMRYMKKLLAVGFQGAGIIGLLYVASQLQVISNAGTDIIIMVALLGSISLVKTAINEMMGV